MKESQYTKKQKKSNNLEKDGHLNPEFMEKARIQDSKTIVVRGNQSPRRIQNTEKQKLKIEAKQSNYQIRSIKNQFQSTLSTINSPSSHIFQRQREVSLLSEYDVLIKEKQQLEKKLEKLSEQLKKIRSIENLCQKSHGEPFYSLFGEFKAFYTKLNVQQQDYDKIDYKNYKFTLYSDYICLEGNQKKKLFSLNFLEQVNYLEENIIFLKFLSDSNHCQSLFIKFFNKQEMDEWDTGIYVNYKILEPTKQKIILQNQTKNIQPTQNEEQKQIQVSEKNKEIVFEEVKDKENKIQEKISFKSFERNKDISTKFMQDAESETFQNGQKQEKLFFSPQKQYEEPESPGKKSTKSYRKKGANEQIEKQLDRIVLTKKQSQKEGKSSRSNSPLKPKEKQLGKNKNIQQFTSQFTFTNVVESLSNGYGLVKYSTGGFSPHEKTVFLHPNKDRLCWVDKGQKKDPKSKFIYLKYIEKIRQGQVGQGIRKQVSEIKEKNRYVTIYMHQSSNRKTLELSSPTPERTRQFCFDLQTFLTRMGKK